MNFTSPLASLPRRFAPSSRINLITGKIIGACITVHKAIGPGLLESAYEACVGYELSSLGLQFERQKPVPLIYHSVKLDCGFRADLVVEGLVVVELKSRESLHPVDHAQLLSHLRLLQLPVGLLINFHVTILKDGITRMVNDYQEEPDAQVEDHVLMRES
jgi:GxxExxY protein